MKKTFRDEASRDIRTACLYTMGKVRTEKSRRFLEEMARDDDRRIARVAAYSLGIDGGEKAIETLSAFWKDAGERRLSWAGAAALGDNGDTKTMATVREIYSSSFNDNERIRAGQVLAMMNNRRLESAPSELIRDEVIPLLKETWSEEASDDIRREIVNGPGIAGGPEEIESLNNISPDDWDLSRSIRRAIRRIEYREENGEDMAVSRMNRMRR